MNDTKSMTQSMPIAGNEYVSELLNILEANNMPGAKDLLTVVNQISTMEKQYSNILTQLSVMREELAEAQRQNHPIKTALQKAVIVMQAQALELRDNLNGLKREIINCCKNAVTAFKEHGLSALRNIAEYIKIRPGLELLRGNIDNGIKQNEATIAKIEAVSAEYHEAGRHIKNIGRAIVGKDAVTEAKVSGNFAKAVKAPFRADRACLVAMRKCVNAAIGAVARLEKTERKPPIMETIEKFNEQIAQTQKDAPERERLRPAVHDGR